MHGFLNIDKPQEMTSFDVIRRLKAYLPRRARIGHLGTLDPMATGVLPVAIGQATRIISYLEDGTKEYLAAMTLGAISDTQDAWGTLTYTGQTTVTLEQVQEVMQTFLGIIQQVPPMYSAVHHQGQRLYELARQGLVVDRPERSIEIISLELLHFNMVGEFPVIEFKVQCSRGTYIRTLCHDIGQKLGTGAFMSALTRTRSGGFALEESTGLDKLLSADSLDSFLLPMDHPLQDWAGMVLDSQKSWAIQHGQSISIPAKPKTDLVRVYDPDHSLLAVAQLQVYGDEYRLSPEKVFINQ